MFDAQKNGSQKASSKQKGNNRFGQFQRKEDSEGVQIFRMKKSPHDASQKKRENAEHLSIKSTPHKQKTTFHRGKVHHLFRKTNFHRVKVQDVFQNEVSGIAENSEDI